MIFAASQQFGKNSNAKTCGQHEAVILEASLRRNERLASSESTSSQIQHLNLYRMLQ
jgi:hypothetical protein